MTTYGKTMTAIAAVAIACAAASTIDAMKTRSRLDRLCAEKEEERRISALSQDERDNMVRDAIDAASRGDAQDATSTAPDAAQDDAAATPPAPIRVLNANYNGDDEIRIQFSARPDMDVVREYVSVEPMNSGVASFRYSTPWGSIDGRNDHVPTLTVKGDYAHRTNVTLRVRKGFPVKGSSLATPPLAEDYIMEFRRKDRDPVVDFADAGRYLPPIGPRAISVKSVNVPEVEVEIRKIPVENAVMMLALEEGEYSHIYKGWARSASVEDEFGGDLAGAPVVRRFKTANEVNKEETRAVPVSLGGGEDGSQEGEKGLFVVRASIAGEDRDDDSWWGDGKNQYRFRLVCVSDLGLSARLTGNGTMLVWLNSFTTGLPVAGADVFVYSSANVLVGRGRTDADGMCRPDRVADGEPFAVVARAADGSDATFIALSNSMLVDETYPDGGREKYLKPDQAVAFAWTERGIYRHGEPVFLQALLRNGANTPVAPMPVEIVLENPSGNIYAAKTLVSDENGAVICDSFRVDADQPSGEWTFKVKIPGKDGAVLGTRSVKIEEFAPPQIRVKTEASPMSPKDFEFAVSAEHLYGGAAKGLVCEGAVVFEDVPFAPADWKGYRFGNEDRKLKPSFRRLKKAKLDDRGRHVFQAPLWQDTGLPSAAVRATGQGTVFEDGGRPASSRASVVCHYYPYYIGTTLTPLVKKPALGSPQVEVACVAPDGRRVTDPKRLVAKVEQVETVYAYRKNGSGWATWDCERIRTTVADRIAVPSLPDGDTVLSLPISSCGDYVLTIDDLESDVSFSMPFYLSDGGDGAVRAPLSRPTAVTVTPDKAFYRVGDTPRIMLKAPFAGTALVTVMRDELVWREVIALTNATAEVELPPAALSWAPNVDVEVSVVQAVRPGEGRFAVRAHGMATVVVRPEEREIPMLLDADVEILQDGGAAAHVKITAGAFPEGSATAVVTVVDEGINLLTDEKLPSPVDFFAKPRTSPHALFDLYHRLLPVLDGERLVANGVKTGGGFGAEMLSRVSPVPTRRFKPLSIWVADVGVRNGEDGKAEGCATVRLPEFVGEVRISVVVYTSTAAGSACVRRKVAPKIVAQPDAPRFVAPGDVFDVTLPVSNRSGAEATVGYSLSTGGPLELVEPKHGGTEMLADGDTSVQTFRVKATGVGEGVLKFGVSGAGEAHEKTILLPVRPAAAWRESAGVDVLEPGASKVYGPIDPAARRSFAVSGSRLSELGAALEWLAAYPHGCLEQTTSRIFPLVTAGGILGSLESKVATNREEFVAAGVRRVESMVRWSDFVMWPDCDAAPWDREVSLYAAHFLVAAENGGVALNPVAKPRVMKFLSNWAMSTNSAVSAYACHTLALAHRPEKDRMLRLYDARKDLDALSRSRLARAFTAIDDRERARELLSLASAPQSVKEAAFSLLALLDLDPGDARIPHLVTYLTAMRDAKTYSWGTTESNAHALLALGAFYRHKGWKAGTPVTARHDNADGSVRFVNSGASEAFVSWRKLEIPADGGTEPQSSVISISRGIFDADSRPADLAKLQRGDLLFVELALSSSENRTYSDLVIEDLFPAAFEPVASADLAMDADKPLSAPAWVLRSDARDDRMLVFSRRFSLKQGQTVRFRYPVRVVSAGDFILPAASVEAMYAPSLRANTSSSRLHVE